MQKDDVIYRQAAIDKLDPLFESLAIDKIKALPTAQPDLQPTCNQLATEPRAEIPHPRKEAGTNADKRTR